MARICAVTLYRPVSSYWVKGDVMTTSILVTGGTGTLGRPVAQRLRDAGASITVLSRQPREAAEGIRYTAGDLSTGEGIEAAVRGAEVIVHCAGSSKGDEQKTRTLVSAARDARHIVLISVVGADRIPQVSAVDRALFGYFGMKLATERVVEQSGIGWTTLRATQFHDLILMVARALAKLPVIPAPTGTRFQPIDATEVAQRMAELALGKPSGPVPDLAGPRIYAVPDLLKSYLSAAGKRRPVVPIHLPGRAAKALRAGANLGPDRAVGKRTWEEFLVERI
ncbi:MAG TPA: NAD(P)H-binding protein [Mycobacterium sp.]|nr:NAD(P)H-binding protein [Mycobacterium sp.]